VPWPFIGPWTGNHTKHLLHLEATEVTVVIQTVLSYIPVFQNMMPRRLVQEGLPRRRSHHAHPKRLYLHTRRHIEEDWHIHQHHCQNLIWHTDLIT
jgi:hypothetical protein